MNNLMLLESMSIHPEDLPELRSGEFPFAGLEFETNALNENGPELEEILAELKIDAPDAEVKQGLSQESLSQESLSQESLSQDAWQPSNGEDEELCTQFFDGSDTSFVQLYAKYETPLLHYCRRVMTTDKLAEDAFQDTWMRIFELRLKRPEITNFKALLFKTARNLCLNTKRLEYYRAGSSEDVRGVKSNDETGRNLEESEIKNLMTRALAKLPFEQREAFVLHEYSGYSYQEIAVMTSSETATVKVRAFRARIRLRKLIASWLGLAEDDDPTNSI